MKTSKLNFKQPKYIYPVIALPFILFMGYQASAFFTEDETQVVEQKELSLSLGETQDSILAKNDAYDAFFQRGESRTMIDGLESEQDSLLTYEDNLEYQEKRYLDSLKFARATQQGQRSTNSGGGLYYNPNSQNQQRSQNNDYQRSADIIRMLNEQSTGGGSSNNYAQTEQGSFSQKTKEEDPVTILRKQMMMMDSLEKARDPQFQNALIAQERLKRNKEKMNQFLNSTLTVRKSGMNPHFNSIAKASGDQFIKAVIDEELKGYLGSRIRFRLLEDIFVGKHKIDKGTILFGQISGFDLQRVNLNIVSVLNKGEILPINLTVYDVDGMQGLYVPQSAFREMMRELGTNSIQGNQMNMNNEGFFSNLLTRAFSSTSQTIANLLRKNKAKIKYNSYIYLINDQQLKQTEIY